MSIELRVKSILDKRQEKVIGYEDILNKLDRCSSLISKAKIAAKPILSGIAITDPHKIGEIKSVVTTLTSLDNSSEISSLRKKS